MDADRGRTDDDSRAGGTASRDGELRGWITDVVHPHSPPVRDALDRCGLGARGVRAVADLGRLPVTPIGDLGDGRSWVLEPTAASLASSGPLADRLLYRAADAFGRRPELASRRVEPAFRPVAWTVAPAAGGNLFVAATAPDLDRLAVIGRRALAISGVGRDDRIVVSGAPLAGVAGWQLVTGCRDAGVAHLHVGGAGQHDVVAAAEPTVLAGSGDDLRAAADAGLPPTVRLLVQLGMGPPLVDALDLPVARWWAPAGVRCAWVACPGGTGFHTWPADEVVDSVDGEIVWSGIGWTGSVWLRLGTGIRGDVHHDPCPACGRPTPRVEPRARAPWAEALDSADAVAEWLVVRRDDGSLAVLVVPSADPPDRWRGDLATRTGAKVVPVSADRLGRARALAGGRDVVDEATVSEALRKVAPA